MIVKRRLNNNVIVALEDGKEIIVSGKGLGFGVYPNDKVNKNLIERKYVYENEIYDRNQLEFLDHLPSDILTLSEDIIMTVEKEFNRTFSPNLLFTLSDHINYALSRKESGLELKNPFHWDIKLLYPQETEMAEVALKIITEQKGVLLSEDEVSFIAMHFVNANPELNLNMNDTMKITKILTDIISIIRLSLNVEFDEQSFEFARLVTHLRYFVKRKIDDVEPNLEIDEVSSMIKNQYKAEYNSTLVIEKYLENNYGWTFNMDERVFLTIHIVRIMKSQKK